MQDLENAASGDATVRQKIASLPQEVQDVSLLEKITGEKVVWVEDKKVGAIWSHAYVLGRCFLCDIGYSAILVFEAIYRLNKKALRGAGQAAPHSE